MKSLEVSNDGAIALHAQDLLQGTSISTPHPTASHSIRNVFAESKIFTQQTVCVPTSEDAPPTS